MPKKTRRSVPAAAPVAAAPKGNWLRYLVTALFAAVLGAAVIYFALLPKLDAATGTLPSALSPTAIAALEVTEGNNAYNVKDWKTAKADYLQAINNGDSDPDVRTDLGTVYRNLRHPNQAMEEYEIVQREDPQHQNSLINEGIVTAFDLHDTAKGIAYWNIYLSRFPHDQHDRSVKLLIAMARAHAAPIQSASTTR